IYNGEARCYPGDKGLDDMLVTPAIALEAGMWYKVQAETHNTTSPPAKDNTISLKLGKQASYEALSETVIPTSTIPLSGNATVKEYFTVDETSQYYLGWQAYNENPYATPIYLNNFTLSAPIKGTVPGAAKLVVTPDKQGALKATVNVTLPTTDLAGNELKSLTRADLYLDGVLYKNFRKSLGAESFDVVIENLSEGPHHFMMYCRNSDGQGRECEVDAYIGINSPGDPVNVKAELTQQEGEVTISWEAPEVDHDGYPINPDWITYEVYVYNSNATSQAELETVVCSSTKNLSFTYQAMSPDEPQQFIRYGVRAMTLKGTSHGVLVSSIPVGTPYSLPYNDSFVNKLPEKIYRHVTIDTNNVATWGSSDQEPSGVYSYDNDNGLGMMLAYWTGGSAALGSARVALDCDNPILSMFVYDYSTPTLRDDNIMGLYVRPDGGDWTMVAEKSVSTWTDNTPGWQKIVIDLSEYAHRNVELAFRGETVSHVYMLIDRITVRAAGANDVTLGGVFLPEETFVGREIPVSVSVKNNGSADVKGKAVNLYRNNELLSSREIDLEVGKRVSLMFTDTITRQMAAESLDYVYYARVDASGENEFNAYDNRSTDKQLPLVDNSTYPTVSSLDGHLRNEAVELNWDAPVISEYAEVITDDFESYPSWANQATGIGGYRLYDRDRLGVLGWQDVQWPIAYQSFQSFFLADFTDPSLAEIRTAAPGLFDAHSGNKALMSLSPADEEAYVNDVIVSPLLGNGDKQLSLWAKSFSDAYPESFEVRYSTTDAEYSSFTNCAYFSGVPGKWTEYSCVIPAEAKYFAIVRNNSRTVCLFIDDMTYAPAGNERLVVEGYNIYRDGKEIAHAYTPGEVMSYIDVIPFEGKADYDVTVLYNRGESPAMSTTVDLSGLGEVSSFKPKASGLTGGIHIIRAAGMAVNVYSIDGAHIASTVGSEDMVFGIGSGFYIVTIGTETFKVIVP
ncbi:MAG: choice-of-anchor J domain-containing protein, partial [Duncaniella sp.]|nr:choice-of-anchor J domain-containing protein [Duncaniella sp.]